MIKQKWRVVLVAEQCSEQGLELQSAVDTTEHSVEYRYSRLSGKTTLNVDGDEFTVRGKPFGIGAARREAIIVGGSQATLSIDKRGRATLTSVDASEIEQL